MRGRAVGVEAPARIVAAAVEALHDDRLLGRRARPPPTATRHATIAADDVANARPSRNLRTVARGAEACGSRRRAFRCTLGPPASQVTSGVRRTPCRKPPHAPRPARGRSRRFAPITSAASCGRSALLEARDQFKTGAITAPALRAVEDDAIRDIVQLPGGPRAARHHRRRVPPHLLPHRLPDQLVGRRDQGRHQRQLPQRGRQRRFRAAGDARHRQGAPRRSRSSAPTSSSCKSVTTAHAEGHDPVADDAALPRRPRRDQPRRLSGPRGVLRRRGAGLSRRARRSRRAPAARYVQLDDTNLAYLCDEKMREGARSRGDDPERAAAPLRQADQRRDRRAGRRA